MKPSSNDVLIPAQFYRRSKTCPHVFLISSFYRVIHLHKHAFTMCVNHHCKIKPKGHLKTESFIPSPMNVESVPFQAKGIALIIGIDPAARNTTYYGYDEPSSDHTSPSPKSQDCSSRDQKHFVDIKDVYGDLLQGVAVSASSEVDKRKHVEVSRRTN